MKIKRCTTAVQKEVPMPDIQDVTILLVEDDPGHTRLVEKNLRRANIKNELVFATNGQEALDYLFCGGAYVKNKHASHMLVMLDLNMPVFDGYQVLERVKKDERSKRIPVPWSSSPPPTIPERWPNAMNSAATSTSSNRWTMSSFPRPSASSGSSCWWRRYPTG
jgi:CheY-like chemotaxis protein